MAGAHQGAGTNGDVSEEPLPPPPTLRERVRGIRVVASALSPAMLDRLRKEGVTVDDIPVRPKDISAFAAQQQCVRLGLDGGPGATGSDNGAAAQRQLPQLMAGPLRIPASSVRISHEGLWERFRKECGMPLPPETPPIPCELQKSQLGGHVVVHVLPP